MASDNLASLRILVPDATINYIQNPSFRFDTSGWNSFQSTATRTLDYARFGISALKVVTNGSSLREGVNYRVSNLTGVRDFITVSAYVRGSGRVRIRLNDNPGGASWVSQTILLNPNRWIRIQVSGRCSGGNDIRLWVETDNLSISSTTFYVDAIQMERKPYSTTYCDGDQPGCRWNIIQSASVSSRDAYTRLGGKWISLSGDNRKEQDLYMTVVGGLGMAPITNNIQSFAIAAGSYFQNTKINNRMLTLTFHAKKKDLFGRDDLSLEALHRLRQFLIDLIKPDLTGGGEEFLLEYMDGDIPLYFSARYDGGLEGEWDIRNKWINSFPLRLMVVSPLLQEDNQEMITIKFQESLVLNGAAARVDGIWNNMNYGFLKIGATVDGQNGDLEIGRKGEIFAAGSFSTANGNNNALDPFIPVNFITYWDGTKWNKLSTGVNTGSTINDCAIAPNGNVYVTGLFSSIGGVSANNIAYWDGSAWNAMGTGLNNPGVHISIAPNGDVYVGGGFSTAGGVSANNIAKWDGLAWRPIGQRLGLNSTVQSIAISPDGLYMYVAGNFTDEFGLSANNLLRIAKYTVSTNAFTAVGSGFAGGTLNALEVIISPSGTVYCCGGFTLSGTTTVNCIAQLVGNAWAPLGSGMDSAVNSFDIGSNGDLIAVGSFTTAGGINCRGIALWNGSSWVNVDVVIGVGKTTITPLAVQFAPNGDVYIGGTSFSLASGVTYQSQVSGITYITNNGSSETSPFVYISGSGRLRWLENQTTKKRVFFDLTILPGEDVFIDFGKGTIISTIRGSLAYSVLPGSDFNAFTLIPGENKIACLMSQDVGATIKMGYTPTHWSSDAMQLREAV